MVHPTPPSQRRAALTTVLAVLLALALATPALAGTASFENGTLTFAGGDEVNQVSFAPNEGGGVKVSDAASALAPGTGCAQVQDDPNSVVCATDEGAAVGTVIATLGGEADTATTALGAVHVAFDGGSGDDILNGGDAGDALSGADGADQLHAGGGDDDLNGGANNDVLDGGDGNDTARYDDRGGNITVSLDDEANDGEGGEGDNVLSNVENVIGGAGDDSLNGNDGNNHLVGNGGIDALNGGGGADTLEGGEGNDALQGGAGPDSFMGGGGTDTVVYGDHAGVNADIDDVLGDDGNGTDGAPGQRDTIFSDVENLFGSNGPDILGGSNGDNMLLAGAGQDTIDGAGGNDVMSGGSGGDYMTGGDGLDVVTYAGRTSAVFTSFDGNNNNDGELNEGDTLASSIEGVVGGNAGDVLVGNAAPNLLDGGPGPDAIIGGEGADSLSGGPGNDQISARDAFADSISCGDNSDSAFLDAKDTYGSDCEGVEVSSSNDQPDNSGNSGSGTNTGNTGGLPGGINLPPGGGGNTNTGGSGGGVYDPFDSLTQFASLSSYLVTAPDLGSLFNPGQTQAMLTKALTDLATNAGDALATPGSVATPRSRARGLSVFVARAGSKIVARGKLRPTAGMSAKDACSVGGKVEATLKVGTRVVSKKRAKIKKNCTYKLVAPVKTLASSVRVFVRFKGNPLLLPFTPKPSVRTVTMR
jgi:Ca2+-binding RTX toxin-like protein